MNIYIKMEVLHRELEGRLLLALIAAERGHHVLLGDLRSLLSHRLWLPPGIYHDKSLTPSRRKVALHRRLVDAGFRVTSQDEEHGLLHRTYDWFLDKRFSEESLGQATAFAWGPYDAEALEDRFPDLRDHVVMTGSPRADLWRPEFDDLYRGLPRPGLPDGRPYLLVTSNAPSLGINPFWTVLRDQQPNYHGPLGDLGIRRARGAARGLQAVAEMADAVNLVADARPHVQVVVRPHPIEDPEAWRVLVGDRPNVVVVREGGLGRWIRAAAVVLHRGSTSGLEAAACGIPLICLMPFGEPEQRSPSQLGRAATTPAEVLALVDEAIAADGWVDGGEHREVLGRLAARSGPLAAERIVEEWERTGVPGPHRPFRPHPRLLAATLHRRAGTLRRAGSDGVRRLATAHKFPGLPMAEVESLVEGLRRVTDRFAGVSVRAVGPRLLALGPARPRRP